MSKTIDIIDEEFKIIVDHYNNEIASIDGQIADLSKRKQSISNRVQELLNPHQNATTGVKETHVDDFKEGLKNLTGAVSNIIADSFESLKIPRRIEYVYNSSNRKELSTREIFDKIAELDSSVKEKEKTTIEAISSYLSVGIKRGDYKVGASTDSRGKKRFKQVK